MVAYFSNIVNLFCANILKNGFRKPKMESRIMIKFFLIHYLDSQFPFPYSLRNASTGSIRLARRAG